MNEKIMQKLLKIIILLFITTQLFSQSLNDKWLGQINKGKEEYAVNNYSEALAFFIKASQIVPTDTTAYTYILDCAYKTQDAKAFFNSFDKLVFLEYESERAYSLAVKTCVEVEKDYQKAVIYVEAAKEKYPLSKDLLMTDILLYFKYGDYDTAKDKLNVFIEKFPDNEKAINLLYTIAYDIKKDYDEALKILEKAQQLFPNEQEYVKKEVNIYIETDHIDAAEEKFRKLIELNPFEAKHYYNLSLILYNKGEYEKSVELASKAIELDPDFLEAIFNVGTFFYHRALQYSEALTKMSPYQYTYQGQGRDVELTAKSFFDAAKPYFERAVELNTNELGAFENLNTINVLLSSIERNQQLTDPYFVDLENEEKHKVYPDYEMVNYQFSYPVNQTTLNKGQVGELIVEVKNTGQTVLDSMEVRLFQPFVNPMLAFNDTVSIPVLQPNQDTIVTIPIKYLLNNPSTVGMEKSEDAKNLIRFFITGSDEKYTDLNQIDILTGKEQLLAEKSDGSFSETIDIDFTPNAKAVNFLLVIGIDNYTHWQPLNNAVNDANNIKNVLLSQYEVDAENVFELYNEDATKSNMINELIKIKRELSDQDNLIIYYAGHGDYNTTTDEGAWVPVDANLNTDKEYLDNTTLLSFLNSLNTKHTFLIADACFSGALFVANDEMTYKPNNDKVRSRWGFTSGNIEYVADGATGEGSPFAQYLAEALMENKREYLAVTELISYVKFKVRNSAIQTPIGRPLKIDGNEGGEFLLYTR